MGKRRRAPFCGEFTTSMCRILIPYGAGQIQLIYLLLKPPSTIYILLASPLHKMLRLLASVRASAASWILYLSEIFSTRVDKPNRKTRSPNSKQGAAYGYLIESFVWGSWDDRGGKKSQSVAREGMFQRKRVSGLLITAYTGHTSVSQEIKGSLVAAFENGTLI